MTAPATPATSAPSMAAALPSGPVRFSALVRSELTKLRSVRSTYWTLIAAVALTLLIGVLATSVSADSWRRGEQHRDFDPMLLTFVGLQFAQLAVGVLGVLAITSEYSTGMIRTTFAAVPRRLRLLTAKALAFSVVVLVASVVTCTVMFFIGQAVYSGVGLHYSLTGFTGGGAMVNSPLLGAGAPGRALFGAVLYLVISGLLGFGLGAMIRRTPGAIVALVMLQFVAVGILFAIGGAAGGFWADLPAWLPTEAGRQIFSIVHQDDSLNSAWGGLAVMAAWAALFLAAAAVLLERRDA